MSGVTDCKRCKVDKTCIDGDVGPTRDSAARGVFYRKSSDRVRERCGQRKRLPGLQCVGGGTSHSWNCCPCIKHRSRGWQGAVTLLTRVSVIGLNDSVVRVGPNAIWIRWVNSNLVVGVCDSVSGPVRAPVINSEIPAVDLSSTTDLPVCVSPVEPGSCLWHVSRVGIVG